MTFSKKTILVTGGAGYIGSVAVKQLCDLGHNVIVVDNLSKGLHDLIDERALFYKTDLASKPHLETIFKINKIDSVIHFASYKAARESMVEVDKYSDNIIGTINLLQCMHQYKVKQIIYSSSAAVYGNATQLPIHENHSTKPVNFYGVTKLQGEEIIQWYAKAHGIQYVFLRYFNVIGDGGLNYVDPSAQNILPVLMEVVFEKRKYFNLFGEDFDTDDGTCVRDYLDVKDLVRAHVLALSLEKNEIINLGTSKGISVQKFVDCVKRISNKDFKVNVVERNEADVDELITNNNRAKKMLDWIPEIIVDESIKDTYDIYLAKNKEDKKC